VSASSALILIATVAAIGASFLSSGDAAETMASWPPLVRAALVGASVALGLALLGKAVTLLDANRPDRPVSLNDRGAGSLIRGVRLAFLAVAAFAAAGAFLVGHPLLLVVAVIIAAVDVIETTFLLVVASRHQGDDAPRS
jgi:hypothetical protein